MSTLNWSDDAFTNTFKPEWPSFFSPAEDIMSYLEKVCKCFDLKKYMHFEAKVLGANWNEQAGKWIVKISQKQSDGTTIEFEDTCDLLLQCTGVLGFPKLPSIPGLETFKGKVSPIIEIIGMFSHNRVGNSHRELGRCLPGRSVDKRVCGSDWVRSVFNPVGAFHAGKIIHSSTSAY